ncbi:hypothetical protein ACPZ19_04005 [Amycolatopsis lurida]
MTERLVIDKTDRFTRRRWGLAAGLIVIGAGFGVSAVRRGMGPDGLYLAGFFAILGLLLLGRMVYTKARKKRVLVLDEQSVELRAVDGSGWLVGRADVERLVLRRIRRADDHRELSTYVYELKLTLRPEAKPRKQNGLTATTRGPVQTTPDRFTEAEAWRIQEFARDRLRVPITASQVPPTVRGQAAKTIPAPPTGKPGHRRQVVVFPTGVSAPVGTVYATRQAPRISRVFTTVMGWIALIALLVLFTYVEISENTALFLTVLGVSFASMAIAGFVGWFDIRWRARRWRITELAVGESGLLWTFYRPDEHREGRIPYRVELRWPEVRSVQVTNHVVDGRTVRTVEIVPGDDGFAKRHPEMQRLWEAGLQVGAAVPVATGSYRLQTEFADAAARRLATAVEVHQPGVLHRTSLAGSGSS